MKSVLLPADPALAWLAGGAKMCATSTPGACQHHRAPCRLAACSSIQTPLPLTTFLHCLNEPNHYIQENAHILTPLLIHKFYPQNGKHRNSFLYHDLTRDRVKPVILPLSNITPVSVLLQNSTNIKKNGKEKVKSFWTGSTIRSVYPCVVQAILFSLNISIYI